MADSLTSYEKQMMWRKASQKKSEKTKEKVSKDTAPSFQPHFYSVPVKDFDGTARDINEKSSKRFIERNLKAKGMAYKLPGPGSSVVSEDSRAQSYAHDSVTVPSGIQEMPPPPPIRSSYEPRSRSHSREYDDISTTSGSDEPIIELLERERRQWQDEREKLIQCIHLQQLELTQRSLAAHERAVDIAKDFARLIGAFEERLVTVETNVQKEIGSLRSITESLLVATGKAPAPNHGTH